MFMEEAYQHFHVFPGVGTAAVVACSLSVCLGLALLYLLLIAPWLHRPSRRRPCSSTLPPGPRPWPLIGNLHLLGALPHQSLAILARTHGPLMSLRLGSSLTIVASSPDMAKSVLQTFDHALASRPRTAASLHTLFDCSDVAFAPYGPYWKLMRRICISDLLHVKHFDSFKPIRMEEMDALVCRVLEESYTGKPVLILCKLQEAANNMISRMVLGKTFTELNISTRNNSSTDGFVELLKEIVYLLGSFNMGDYMPYLAWMDLQGLERRMKDAKRRLKTVLGMYIADRRAAAGIGSETAAAATSGRDLLDVLLSLQASGQQQQLDAPVTDDNIIAVILDMYMAGTETSAITIEWAIAELMSSPGSMEKVKEELDRVVGRERLVQESDIKDLLYLHTVVKETMRLHPVAPLLLPHLAMQPCSVGGYCIPAEATVYVNVWAIGRDPEVWEEPLAFRPERFFGSEVDVRGNHFELLPFGSGRRRCPGWELGLLSMCFMAARLLQCFDWSLPGGRYDQFDLSEGCNGINMLMANKLELHACPRLPISLYPHQQHGE